MTAPSVMPVVSRGVTAYTNDDFTGAFPASHANNSAYSDYWRCATTPTGNANSGTLTQAVYLAYDLSGVPSAQRGQCVIIWYNDPSTGAYDPTLIANNAYNIPTTYTIDANSAAGGTLPTSGWTTLATVSGSNPYHSRQHSVNLAGYNWVRINVTAITGSASNNNIQLNMDVHDAHLGNQDNWMLFGDSITQRGLNHQDTTVPAQINTLLPSYFPLMECGGIGGFTATDEQAVFATHLALFTGRYVSLNYGTNDANLGGSYVTNYQSKMTNMVGQIVSAGKIPILAHIPYGTTANIVANGPTINSAIDTIIAATPGALKGPDLWAYFQANQGDISGDGIHPTDPAGYTAYATQWVNWAVANVYSSSGNPYFVASHKHHRMAFS